MRYRLAWVVAAYLLTAGSAQAQWIGNPRGWPTCGYGGSNSRLTLTYSRGRVNGFVSVNRFYDLPWYGCSPGFSAFLFAPPPITVVQPIYVPVMTIDTLRGGLPALGPGIAADRRVLEPEPEIVPRPAPPQPAPIARPEMDPKLDLDWFLRTGMEAFAAGDYELARRRFQQAAQAAPAEAVSYFLLAQADLAMGQFDKASRAVEMGLVKQPNWPTTGFEPRELYGLKAATFGKHLQRLFDAAADRPKDDALLFLLGYQMWFDGRRDESLIFFRRAAALAADTTAIDRFLKAAKPPRGVPVAER